MEGGTDFDLTCLEAGYKPGEAKAGLNVTAKAEKYATFY